MAEDEGGDFLGRIFAVADVDADRGAGRPARWHGDVGGVFLAGAAADEALDGIDGVRRDRARERGGGRADERSALGGEMDDGRREALAFAIGEEDGKARVHDADEGVGGAEVDADDHGETVKSKVPCSYFILHNSSFPMPFPSLPRPAALALLCAAVLLTRLPFLDAGYGEHADNWRIALAARHIAETGVYEASRFPGYPIQEYVCSWLWRTGPVGFNLLDALFCTAAALFFALICIEYGVGDWWLAGLALAFVPVLYVNSVSSKDFPWALAFLMAAWWCALRKKPVLTGLLLGLAMGCRITSGAAALPIALILIDGAENRAAIRRVVVTALVSAVVVIAAFVPVYTRYGTDFFNFYAEHAFPSPLEIAARMTLESGGFSVSPGFASRSLPRRRGLPSGTLIAPPARVDQHARHLRHRLLLPAGRSRVPDPRRSLRLLLAWRVAPRWAFRACYTLIIASPFVTWSAPAPDGGPHFPGSPPARRDGRANSRLSPLFEPRHRQQRLYRRELGAAHRRPHCGFTAPWNMKFSTLSPRAS